MPVRIEAQGEEGDPCGEMPAVSGSVLVRASFARRA
jgi:hypothetical protein